MHHLNSELDLEAIRVADKLSRIARDATQKAIEENLRLGIPNVYSINSRLYYELPSGELTLQDPGIVTPQVPSQPDSGVGPTA